MQRTRSGLARRIKDNWLELLLLAVLAAALLWMWQTGRGVWKIATAEPTPTPTTRPLIEGQATPSPTPLPAPTAVTPGEFAGVRAQEIVTASMALGPRPIGSAAHGAAATAIVEELTLAGWQVEEQAVDAGGVALRTIVGKAGRGPLVVLGTHYDTPASADLDPVEANRALPAPGANDGTSSTAVLLELARALDKDKLANEVWLVFFDGQYPPGGGEPVSAGASAFAESLPSEPLPQAVILLDFVGAADEHFFLDRNSDPALNQALWTLAQRLSYGEWFLAATRDLADNGVSAFRERNIPASNIAALDYPYRRTVADTADKVDAASLERVGRLLLAYLQPEGP